MDFIIEQKIRKAQKRYYDSYGNKDSLMRQFSAIRPLMNIKDKNPSGITISREAEYLSHHMICATL